MMNPIPISPTKLRSDLHNIPCDGNESTAPSVISVLASLLERTIARNEKASNLAPMRHASTRAFDCDRVLDMSLLSFFNRIHRYACVAPPVYVVAYVYMDRLCQFNPGLRITSANVHRFLITAVMVASKFLEDMNYGNTYFAQVGGISARELNSMEVEFLFLLKFKLHVSVSVFESYCSHLEREVSFGGGYQIETSLRLMCSEEMQITDKDKLDSREFNHVAPSLRLMCSEEMQITDNDKLDSREFNHVARVL